MSASELPPPPLPVGQGPGARGGQLWSVVRRSVPWESLKGPRTLSRSQLTFPTGYRMRGLLILSVLLGAVLGKEDFAG